MNPENLIFMARRLEDLVRILDSGDVNPQVYAIHKSEYLSKFNIIQSYRTYPLDQRLIDYADKLRQESKK